LPFDGLDLQRPAAGGLNDPDVDGAWFDKFRFVTDETGGNKDGTPGDRDHPSHRFGTEENKAMSDRLGELDIPKGQEHELGDYEEVNNWLGGDAIKRNESYKKGVKETAQAEEHTWAGEAISREEAEPEDTPAKLSGLDALKMEHDELAQQFTQLQADLEEAKKLPNKTKKEKLAKVAKIKGVEREKARVSKAGKRQQAKIAAHPDTPNSCPSRYS